MYLTLVKVRILKTSTFSNIVNPFLKVGVDLLDLNFIFRYKIGEQTSDFKKMKIFIIELNFLDTKISLIKV